MIPAPAVRVLVGIAAVAAVSGAACRGGCARAPAVRGPLDGTLAWFPPEARIVVSADFRRLRRTRLGQRLPPLAATDADDRQRIDEFVRRTGFDPFEDIDALTIAFPEEARASGQLGVILRASHFDESRLVAYARDQVSKTGDDLFSFRRSGRVLWAAHRAPTTAVFFAGEGTLVVGAGGWAERMAELSEGSPARAGETTTAATTPPGAEANLELVHLIERAGSNRPLVAVAIVPASTRASLAADPGLSVAAGVSRLALSLDGDEATDVLLTADLATREQALRMVEHIDAAVRAAKASPRVLLLGIGPFLDSLHARATGVSCEIAIHLSPAQTDDAIERLRAFVALARQGPIPGFPRP
jgi:hypothetical protein